MSDEALARRDGGQEFDPIVSDIEMLGGGGFEVARECRGRGSWQPKPTPSPFSAFRPKCSMSR
jgi:CheY-like chemotaxis protein